MLAGLGDPGRALVDVRSPEEFRGEHFAPGSPPNFGARAGHIPGAKSAPYTENLDSHGRFLPPEQLAERFHNLLGDTPAEDAFRAAQLRARAALARVGAAGPALPGRAAQARVRIGRAIALDGSGNILEGSTAIPGCLASWFTPAASTFLASNGTTVVTLPADLAGSDYITGSSAVTLTNAAVAQDACQGRSPKLNISVS